MYTKKHLALVKFSSKTRQKIDTVYFSPTYTVATDSYSLVALRTEEAENFKSFQVKSKTLSRLKLKEASLDELRDLAEKENTFPDYSTAAPRGEPLGRITINATFLRKILQTLGEESELINIKIYGEKSPLVIETSNNANAFALLMPCGYQETAQPEGRSAL